MIIGQNMVEFSFLLRKKNLFLENIRLNLKTRLFGLIMSNVILRNSFNLGLHLRKKIRLLLTG